VLLTGINVVVVVVVVVMVVAEVFVHVYSYTEEDSTGQPQFVVLITDRSHFT